jgi:glycosyltransferase involved in cell wall biosynthesis
VRVVHIFKDYYPPTTGGIEQHMRLLCTALAARHEVTVLVPSRSRRAEQERIDGVDVIRVPEFGRYASAPLCPSAPWRLRQLRPDLVHLHFPNPMGDLTYLLSGVRAPLVVSYHADIVKQRAYLPVYRPVIDHLFRRAARIIAASEEYAATSEFLRDYRDRTEINPYGIDTSSLALANGGRARVDQLRAQYGDRSVLFVGVLRYYKGIDVLIRAMTEVNGRALIVGRGIEGTALMALAEQLGVADRVVFLGEVPDAQLRALMHVADVFVLPSIDRCEAFGIVQLEAMACGKPVVSTDLPTGVRFVNQHEVTGLIVPPGDAHALAGALTRLLDDPALRSRMGDTGRARVTEKFDVARMVARTQAVYDDVLRESGRA